MRVASRQYGQWQREAIAAAYARMTAARTAELAASGFLPHPSGARLDPFHVPENTVRSIARRARRKQAATQATLGLLGLTPRDAVEGLRQHLIVAISTEFDRIDIEQAGGRLVGGEALRQVARAVRELAAIPGPNDPRPPAPGAKVNGVRNGAETRGGLAGRVFAAHRGRPLPSDATPAP